MGLWQIDFDFARTLHDRRAIDVSLRIETWKKPPRINLLHMDVATFWKRPIAVGRRVSIRARIGRCRIRCGFRCGFRYVGCVLCVALVRSGTTGRVRGSLSACAPSPRGMIRT